MPRNTKPLTNTEIKNAKPVESKDTTLFDGGGLYLLLTKKGSKLWRFKYRFNGKAKLMGFGSYPEVSLVEAREKRMEIKKLITKGVCPSTELERQKHQVKAKWENTFKKVALEWRDNRTDLAESTKKLHINRMERDIFPVIGDLPISEITPRQILEKVLRPMEARGIGEMTARVKNIISQVCRYGVSCGYVERDPTVDLAGALKRVKRRHRAAITDPHKLAPLLRSIDEYEGYYTVRCAFKLAPLLFVRPGELRSMKWAELDLDNAVWQYRISKTHTDHVVPLAYQAVKILESLRSVSGTSEYVFPSVRSNTRPMSNNTLTAALRRLGYTKEEIVPHGFRATARTILEEILNERVDLIEHQLAHSVKDPLGRAYNRTKHLPERTRMMQEWADYLDGLKNQVGKDELLY